MFGKDDTVKMPFNFHFEQRYSSEITLQLNLQQRG